MVHCCIIGCKSRSERKAENITFHSFPKKSAVRQLWIRATGRPNWEPTKYTRICSRHFEQNCFRKTQNKTYLNESSLPTLHIVELSHVISSDITTSDQEVKNPSSATSVSEMDTKTFGIPLMEKLSTSAEAMDFKMSYIPPMEKPSTSTEVMDLETSSNDSPRTPDDTTLTPRKLILMKELRRKTILAESRRKQIAALRSKTRRLQKKNADLSAILENLQSKRYLNQEAADLLFSLNSKDSNFLKPNNSKYSPEVRKFALNLHFISPRAYNFVRQHFSTCLPHTRTLTRWYKTVDGEPGFCSESLDALKLMTKIRSDPSKKFLCGLSFDEMAIRKRVEWDGAQFTGFADRFDSDQNVDDHDNLTVAKEALVFMLTCLNNSWKLPIGYFFVNSVTAEQKASLVKTCIDLVSECGVDIVSLTFDGCPANFSMSRVLGCKLDGEEINTVFIHKGKKVAIFPDPSHMLKLTRNTLGDKAFLINGEGKMVCWHFIRFLVELQEQEGCHLGNKVREAHVNYKKQIMKVKLAAQLFSESVANAIEFCKDDLKLEQFQNSEATVDFIRKFNNLFDILNSTNLNSYGCKKPLNLTNYEKISKILNDTSDYIKSLRLGNMQLLKTNRKTGFLGFLVAIQSILFLYNEYIKTNVLKFLCTYKLSQDHLEMFFSAIRAKGGFNNNPTATHSPAALAIF